MGSELVRGFGGHVASMKGVKRWKMKSYNILKCESVNLPERIAAATKSFANILVQFVVPRSTSNELKENVHTNPEFDTPGLTFQYCMILYSRFLPSKVEYIMKV
jgi:hypothetical protein